MKRLLIVRHAKSSWEVPSLSDVDRPLKPRGVADVYELALTIRPYLQGAANVLSSPAVRALHTAIILSRSVGISCDRVAVCAELYPGDKLSVLAKIESTSVAVDSLIVVGHNPFVSNLVTHFMPGWSLDLPTACGVALDFAVELWDGIAREPVFAHTQFMQ